MARIIPTEDIDIVIYDEKSYESDYENGTADAKYDVSLNVTSSDVVINSTLKSVETSHVLTINNLSNVYIYDASAKVWEAFYSTTDIYTLYCVESLSFYNDDEEVASVITGTYEWTFNYKYDPNVTFTPMTKVIPLVGDLSKVSGGTSIVNGNYTSIYSVFSISVKKGYVNPNKFTFELYYDRKSDEYSSTQDSSTQVVSYEQFYQYKNNPIITMGDIKFVNINLLYTQTDSSVSTDKMMMNIVDASGFLKSSAYNVIQNDASISNVRFEIFDTHTGYSRVIDYKKLS